MQAAKLLGAPKEACSVRCPFWGRLRGSRHSLEPPDCRLWINQQPQPQLLSQPLFPQPPKPQPPQQTRMSTSIRIQVQLFPPKQLLHIEKTSFFCLHHILCRLLQMCYVLMRLSDLIPQLIICTLFQKQLLMRADFLDSVVSENHYSVIILNGGKAMCNREGGAVMR